MKREEKTAAVRRDISRIPCLSGAAVQLLKLAEESDHGIARVVEIVKNDAVLTSRVLMVVNSPAFARRAVIHSIDHAVALLGEDLVVGAALNEAAALLFGKKLEGYAAEEGEFWRHNLKTAIAAKLLAARARRPVNPALAFTCGLLHDLGKAVISDYLGKTAGKITRAVAQGKVADYLAAERALLGIDHAEAGYEIARLWNLPTPLPEACRYHHHPATAPEPWQGLLYVIHLADIVAMLSGVGTGADALQYHLDRGYESRVELDETGLARIMLQVEEEFALVSEVF